MRPEVTFQALWTVGCGELSLRTESSTSIAPDNVVLHGIYSGVSRGTERLVLRGQVPESEYARMRCPYQEGEFPFPVKYGYSFIGEAMGGEFQGQPCFALSPHQEMATLPAAAIVPLPDGLPPLRAVLAANMETALNVLWDAEVQAGDRVLVVGAGVVGLLIASLAARIPGVEVTIADINPRREAVARRLGASFHSPSEGGDGAGDGDMDVVIDASASEAGLRYGISQAGLEARIVVASWLGTTETTLALGGGFHAQRLKLISSQVGRIPSEKSPRWTHRRRLQTALRLLADMPELDALITHELPLHNAPARLPDLLENDPDVLCVAIRYDSRES